jgi:hypothetical protein
LRDIETGFRLVDTEQAACERQYQAESGNHRNERAWPPIRSRFR